MDDPTFDAFVASAMYLADHGDGTLDRQELRTLLRLAADIGQQHGLSATEATHRATSSAESYISQRNALDRKALHALFQQWIADIQSTQPDHEGLAAVYRDLVRVAASDGQMGLGEKEILKGVRAQWALDS